MLHELPTIYRWITRDVLGAPSILDQEYLNELKSLGVLFVMVIWKGDTELRLPLRVNGNLDHPRVPNWLWVNEDPEVFLYLFSLFSYTPRVKPRNVICLSVPGREGRSSVCMKIPSMISKASTLRFSRLDREHHPFLLSLEGQGCFLSYWSIEAGLEYVLVTYKRLNVDQQDVVDILILLFSDRNLKSKSVIGRPSEAKEAIVKMTGQDVTLARLRNLLRSSPAGGVPSASGPNSAASGPSSLGQASTLPVSSPNRERESPPPQGSSGKRPFGTDTTTSKRPRSEGAVRDFSLMDRSFDALGFIASYLLVPKAQEELNLWKLVLEEQKSDAKKANDKVEGDLKTMESRLENLKKEKEAEIVRLQQHISELESEVGKLQKLVATEKVRADLSESSIFKL
ncbi:hypothetical protein PIB30_001485 [Stylosanthes scabra]|uniref:Uncharacterized protein n=1 Tax=Stylosanthes scabra TaxID=79078 RepID=A0ABU6Q2I3_9FABA|nr:hypothetical protein [Stylosanthes scabra]